MKPFRTTALLACVLILSACSQENTKPKRANKPVPVNTAVAQQRSVPIKLRTIGHSEASESVALKSRVEGQVLSVSFAEGQEVKRGDLLLQIDPTDYEARLEQALAAVERDRVLLEKAKNDTARYSKLRKQNYTSDEKLSEKRNAEATASASLKANRATARLVEQQRSYTKIRAPISGEIGERLVTEGNSIRPYDTTVAVINRIKPLTVRFSVPEKHLAKLHDAMKARHESGSAALPLTVTLPDTPSKQYAGNAYFIDNAVDPTTGTILMKATLPNDDKSLRPGQFVNLTLVLERLENAVTVPDEAVQQGPDGLFVFVVKDDLSVEVRRVKTLLSEGGFTAISEGVKAGETVVTDGQLRLFEGAKVKVTPATAS